jgi:Crp-like helix-turn-helix domain
VRCDWRQQLAPQLLSSDTTARQFTDALPTQNSNKAAGGALVRRKITSFINVDQFGAGGVKLDESERHTLDFQQCLSKLISWSAACEAARLAEHLTDAGRRSAYERVSHMLLELFFRLKTVGLTDGMSFHMPLTQELIGDALGLTTIHVNRTLRLLREDHLIDVVGKRVTIRDFEALSLLSDFETSYLGDSARAMLAATSVL